MYPRFSYRFMPASSGSLFMIRLWIDCDTSLRPNNGSHCSQSGTAGGLVSAYPFFGLVDTSHYCNNFLNIWLLTSTACIQWRERRGETCHTHTYLLTKLRKFPLKLFINIILPTTIWRSLRKTSNQIAPFVMTIQKQCCIFFGIVCM